MASSTLLTDLPYLTTTHRHSFPAINSPQKSSRSSTFLNPTTLSSNIFSFPLTSKCSKLNQINYPPRLRFRCSFAKDFTISPPKVDRDESSGPSVDCVVVGAGISGLCIAQALATKHGAPKVMVTEARDRVGGNITTRERDGYLWEEGPNSFQPSDAMLTVAVDNGLKDDLVLGDPTAPRFVLWDGKLRPVPSKPNDLPFFDLMSIPGKLRAGFGAIGIRPPPPGYEESVEEFVRRNLGDEVFERLIEPFCSGVYAGDPAKLSMRAAFEKVWKLEQNGGSIIGGAFKAFQNRSKNPKAPRDPRLPKPKGQTVGSFRKGLVMLPDAISTRLGDQVKLSWKLSSINKVNSGGYKLAYETPEGLISVQTKSVVMTVPSHVASSLLKPLSSSAADSLSELYYPPVAAVSISYPNEAIKKERLIDGELKGFGQLHPRTQGVETLGMLNVHQGEQDGLANGCLPFLQLCFKRKQDFPCQGTIYSSALFHNRAPPGRVLLLNFIGGATNTGIVNKTESEIVEAVDRDLRKMLINSTAKDPLVLGVRVWPQAIPQFLIGHLDTVQSAKCALKDGGFHGLFLGGNYVSGVALGRCVDGAFESAAEVSEFLSKSSQLR